MPLPRRKRTIREREDAVLAHAERILQRRARRHGRIDSVRDAEAWLRVRLAGLPHEELHALWLDQHYRVIGCDVLASGSADGANIDLRVVMQRALLRNARAAILAYNHPSGDPTPSAADRAITARIAGALQMIDVELFDHLVVGRDAPASCAKPGFRIAVS